MEEFISKAATLLEALPYMQRFRDQIFVIKYGGSFMDSSDPEVRDRVARDIVFLETVGINPVVVHGGGKAITRALDAAGLPARFVHGYRVTDSATIEVVERVLSREINPEIVAAIEGFGGKAKTFAGSDTFRCRKFVAKERRRSISDMWVKCSQWMSLRYVNVSDGESRPSLVRRRAVRMARSTIAMPTSPRLKRPSP